MTKQEIIANLESNKNALEALEKEFHDRSKPLIGAQRKLNQVYLVTYPPFFAGDQLIYRPEERANWAVVTILEVYLNEVPNKWQLKVKIDKIEGNTWDSKKYEGSIRWIQFDLTNYDSNYRLTEAQVNRLNEI